MKAGRVSHPINPSESYGPLFQKAEGGTGRIIQDPSLKTGECR